MPRIKILRNVGRKDTLPKSNENPNSLELPAKPDGSMYLEGEVAQMSQQDADKFVASKMGAVTDQPVGPPPAAPALMAAVPAPMLTADPPRQGTDELKRVKDEALRAMQAQRDEHAANMADLEKAHNAELAELHKQLAEHEKKSAKK